MLFGVVCVTAVVYDVVTFVAAAGTDWARYVAPLLAILGALALLEGIRKVRNSQRSRSEGDSDGTGD
jgi:hypothetical protein